MKIAAPLLVLAALAASGCAAIPTTPVIDGGPAAVAGSLVRLGQPVWISAQLVATPMEVHEDSRCPMNARCVWAGRVVVLTRIDGAGWRETAYLTLGEPHQTHGTTITLSTTEPGRMTGSEIAPSQYRFGYESGN
ncbi:MAG: hypothetical protein KDE15_08900 [Erythrobacter sp.]|nr:hypothetical protein [Erythrobacter sp.]